MKSTLLSVALSCGVASLAWAQNAKLNKANKYFRELNYQGAIELYEQILKKEMKPQALFNLAECYRKIGDTRQAERLYSQSITHPEALPEMYVHLGQALLSNRRPADARRQFEKFLSMQPSDTRAKNLLRACNDTVRLELENAGLLYQVKAIEEINTTNDDFGAAFYKKGIVFASEKDTGGVALRRSAWTGRPFLDLFYTNVRLIDEDKLEFKFSRPEEFGRELQTKWHDASVCFNEDHTQILLTRNYIDRRKVSYSSKGVVNTKIIQAKRVGEEWQKIENAAFSNPEFSVMHPALTPDGYKLYFSSDMDGGFGGMDLYVAYNENGNWSAPINLGPGINTEGDEVFPYVSKDGLLYFASDGHTGMGGLDIYYSRATRGVWSPVANMGAPINSNKDDFGFVIDATKKYGFVSSNRDGGKGLTDIYLFKRLSVDATLLVFDKATGKGLENVDVTCDCFPRKTFKTNVDGMLYMELPMNKTCHFTMASEAANKEMSVSTQGYAVGSDIFEQVPMDLGAGLKFVVDGKALDKDENTPLSSVLLTLLNSCTSASQTVIADENGKFIFNLEPNCCYVVRAAKEGYFTATTNFCTKGLYKSDTLEATIEMPRLLTINGNTITLDTNSVFIADNIYHEYDKADINVAASTGLESLLTLMQNNPDIAIEIRSHTDSRGSGAYNFNLSTRRAKAIADYLISKGIAETRLAYKGMGESELVNGCGDSVPCSEEEHQQNRRTEFRIMRFKSE